MSIKIDIVKALKHAYKGCEWSIGETYDTLVWISTHVPMPTEQEIEAAFEAAQAAEALIAHKPLRAADYPAIEEQLDMLWHSMETGAFPKSDLFFNTIKAVKLKYPKHQ